MSYNNKFCKYGKPKSPFQNKISRKEAKENYIANKASENLNVDDGIEEINKAQDDAATSYKDLSFKEKRNLRKT